MGSPSLQSWLNLVCTMLPQVKQGLLVRSASTLAWPADSEPAQELGSAAALAAAQGTPVVSGTNDTQSPLLVAFPLTVGGAHFGVIALTMTASTAQQPIILQLLDWSQSWLRLLLSMEAAEEHREPEDLDFLPALLAAPDLDAVGIELTSGLATRLRCDRVWLGVGAAGAVSMVAVSHQSGLDGRVNLVGMVEEAMAEALALGEAVVYPPKDDAEYFAHALLSRNLGNSQLLCVPVTSAGIATALLFERVPGESFTSASLSRITALATVAAGVVALHERLKPGLLARLEKQLRVFVGELTGPEGFVTKLVVGGLVAVVLVLTLVKGDFQVKSEALTESLSQQAIAAPFDGYILESHARAGDVVSRDQLLAVMDDRDLTLEMQGIVSERDALNRQYRQALAAMNQAESQILRARVLQVEAKIALLENRLAQISLRAPIDGVIISGDLSRILGAPVVKGDLLFELAPADTYRLVLRVNERDIDEVREGQQGYVVLAAHPQLEIPFVVENISTVLSGEETSDVVFRTEASINGDFPMLRPGMEGVGRVSVGRRALGWIYFHDLIDWMRLFIWRWVP